MKIKCPFCKNIYDPEACDNTCPACNKKLLVSVFKKKPEGKPGAVPATTIKPTPPPMPLPAAAPVHKPAAPVTEFVAPKAPVIMPAVKPPTTVAAPAVHEPPMTKVGMPIAEPPAPAPAPAPVASPHPPIHPPAHPHPHPQHTPHAEKKHTTQRVHAKPAMDLVISIKRGDSAEWDSVIRVPVQVFRLANLIPARAREAIEAEGIDFAELRKAAEHAEQAGSLLDIQTQTERFHIAIEPHG